MQQEGSVRIQQGILYVIHIVGLWGSHSPTIKNT